VSAKWGGHI